MRDIKIGFIASTQANVDRALAVAKRLRLNLTTALAALEEAIHPGLCMEAQGMEVIISRRGTAKMLQGELSTPVLSLPDTQVDLLRALSEASSLSKRIVLTSFHRDEIPDVPMLERLFGIRLSQAIFKDISSLTRAVAKAKEQGCDLLVGGGTSIRLAQQHGMKHVDILTSESAIRIALDDAKSVAQARREERERATRYRTILDSASEGMVAVDSEGRVTTINRAAREFLRIPGEGDNGGSLTGFLTRSAIREVARTGRAALNVLETIGQERFIANHVPIPGPDGPLGAVATFMDASGVMQAENELRRSFSKGLTAKYRLEDFIHRSDRMRALLAKIRRYAASGSTLLVLGETGTGKEIIAHAIHLASPRRRGPFVSINCSALPDQLLESELFGYAEGAFTGSRRGGKPGLFELAHQGTIFLDEVATMPVSVQAHLLRVLQEREVMRIGGDRMIPVDVRVVAAANRDLAAEVRTGRLREDLFFRLNVLSVTIPPLRERPEDLPVLVRMALARSSARYGSQPFALPQAALERLARLPWPGNVRQLEYFVERLVLLCVDTFNQTVFDELHAELVDYTRKTAEQPPTASNPEPEGEGKAREELLAALELSGRNMGRAAANLGISRSTLWRRLKKLGLARGYVAE